MQECDAKNCNASYSFALHSCITFSIILYLHEQESNNERGSKISENVENERDSKNERECKKRFGCIALDQDRFGFIGPSL